MFVFSTIGYEQEDILEAVAEKVGDVPMSGATFEGIIGRGYRAGDFRDAQQLFADCLVKAPLDEGAALYIGRCVELIARPPAGVWDGTTVLTGK